jgi:phosphoribosylformimino-5-aminoimidazole carboxamide ribotide isomerase
VPRTRSKTPLPVCLIPPIEIIPVIDLLGGCVVHAHRGERYSYRPIESRLCQNRDPLAVTGTLVKVAKARCCYLADLDAIQNRGDQHDLIANIVGHYPDIEFWVDSGNALPSTSACLRNCSNVTTVVGSESYGELEGLTRTLGIGTRARTVLSLDFKNGALLGPPAILTHSEIWPPRVIVMTLDQVGANTGPGLATIAVLPRPKATNLYAAGGVRNRADLQKLAHAGVRGVLVASALHAGTVF